MATPTQLREDAATVSAEAEAEFYAIVAGLSEADAIEALYDELPGLTLVYADMAATVAAEWYDEARISLDVPGGFEALPADVPDPGVDGLLGWAQKTASSFPAALSLAQGGLQKRVANGARLTVARNAARDPRADGWQRYARPEGCGFCKMLAGRAILYRSEDTADFGAHDFCQCQAAVAFTGTPRPVQPYTPGAQDRSKAGGSEYERARAWLAKHA